MTAAKEPAPRQALFSILHVGTGHSPRGSPPCAPKAALPPGGGGKFPRLLQLGQARQKNGSPLAPPFFKNSLPCAAKAALSPGGGGKFLRLLQLGQARQKKGSPQAPPFFKNSLPRAAKAAFSPGGGGKFPRLLQLGQAGQKREPPGSPFSFQKTHSPVLPKPPSPRAVADSSPASSSWGRPGKKGSPLTPPLF